ncbi:LysR family transcriptional regulator [Conexibacter sp. DBS9H8]|uniref:LysR family transcriptional regulator n=1 Tax=Conexibacter sp. DBS9H8 TaxID=2937801 RepID=UPI00200CE5BF|nr:LysR family transcriptional regulator [Conexibacter sp. DBS9H8]
MTFTDADPLPGSELAAFVAAIESGTVQGAADALALTQSAATKRIQRLESRGGGPLLTRGHSGVEPTDLGKRLYPLAKQALAALSEAGAALTAAGETRELRLSSSFTVGEFLLPGWMASFRTQLPGVHGELEVVNSALVVHAVREGESEIGFVEGLDPLEGLEVLTLAHDRLVVVIAADHRWARRRAIAPAELVGEPYLTREKLSGTRAVAESALAAAGISLAPALSVASLQSLKRAIAAGGFAIISELSVEAEQRAGTLAAVPIQGLDLSRALQAVRRARGPHAAPAAAFWRWLERLAILPSPL